MVPDSKIEDCIAWKFTTNSNYMAGSAYKAQFFGSTSTNFHSKIWKIWTPPKCKHFAWLAIQNRLWTSDRLQHRGWPKSGQCALGHQLPETAVHLFTKRRYSIRVWNMTSTWLSLVDLKPIRQKAIAKIKSHKISVAQNGFSQAKKWGFFLLR